MKSGRQLDERRRALEALERAGLAGRPGAGRRSGALAGGRVGGRCPRSVRSSSAGAVVAAAVSRSPPRSSSVAVVASLAASSSSSSPQAAAISARPTSRAPTRRTLVLLMWCGSSPLSRAAEPAVRLIAARYCRRGTACKPIRPASGTDRVAAGQVWRIDMPPSTGMIGAVEEAGRREAQAERHLGDLLGVAVAPQRHPPAGVGLLVLVADRRRHAGADRARADAVDGDALAAELDGEALGQPDDAGLGRRVGDHPGRRHDRLGRGDVDDPPVPARPRGAGTARRTRWAWAVRLTATVRSQLATKSSSACWRERRQGDAGVVDEDVDAAERRRPRRRRAGAELPRSPTSHTTPTAASGPWAPVISSTTASTPSWPRSTTATRAPSSANRCAVARPIPLAAPVTRARRPAIDRDSDVEPRGSRAGPRRRR